MRILVVEDETKVASFIQRGLEAEHYTVDVASDGDTGLARALEGHHDLLILDLMLPGRDGAAVLRELRARRHTLPILLLTARATVVDKVRGLDLGADDYLTKPFSNDELQARVRACLRRASSSENGNESSGQPEILQSEDGYLYMNMVKRQVRAGDRDIRLTPTEFELLRQLMLYAGKVLTHRSLLRAVWGPEYGEEADYLRVYVRQLRLKVEKEPSNPRYIITEPGIGYVFRGNVVAQNV